MAVATGRPAAAKAPAGAIGHAGGSAWRADIDGLRAVAVLPVVAFHLAQSFCPGGYVGVDVFFVISGYLIGNAIVSEVDVGRFSVLRFYERRLRRIFPAYAAVLVFVLAVALLRGWPTELKETSEAALAALGSVTNIVFWATAGYFEQPAEELPLLHTWSLSVEEQYYLVFPALVMGVVCWTRARLAPVVFSLIAASVALSVYGAFAYPEATFYLLPARAWELLVGASLALGAIPPLRDRALREVACAIGLALILGSIAVLTSATPFPGLAAIPPCLGAALIIHAGASGPTLVGRVLSIPPMVFVGLISYSLYLWHWPLLVLQKTEFLLVPADSSKLVERTAVLAASFIFAFLSWRFIERPTRDRRRVPTRMLILGSGAAALAIAAVSIVSLATGGLPGRFSSQAVAVASYLDYDETAPFREDACFLGLNAPFSEFDRELCLPRSADRPGYLLLGDSHAAALYQGFRQAFPEANVLQTTAVACAPLIVPQIGAGASCAEMIAAALDALPKSHGVKRVFLTARWNASRLDHTAGWSREWLTQLKATVEAFRSRGVDAVVIGPSDEYQSALPGLLAQAIEDGDPGLPQRRLLQAPVTIDRMMAEFAAANGVRYVSLIGAVRGPDGSREYAAPGVPVYFDSNHYTVEGSALAGRTVADAMRRLDEQ